MTEGYKKSFNNIFGWKVIDGKVSPPDFDLPQCAWERINFFVKEYENGLTFEGALRFVMAHDEHECMVDYNIGGLDEWLPVTPEFEEWRDSIGDKSMELAVALIYGTNKKGVD